MNKFIGLQVRNLPIIFIVSIASLIFGCQGSEQTTDSMDDLTKTAIPEGSKTYTVQVKELVDKDYPDNPDIGYYSKDYQNFHHTTLNIHVQGDSIATFEFNNDDEHASKVTLKDLNILTFMPGVPSWVKDDSYLTEIGIVNQEWNRQQVKFTKEDAQLIIEGGDVHDQINRVDLARNCLNSGLWEIAMWKEEDGESKIYYHGWFDFPLDLYSNLVNKKSGIDYETYKPSCVEWREPAHNPIDLNKLRTRNGMISALEVHDLQDEFYPKKGARLKKYKNIIYPENPTKISQFLTDSSLFSTFTIPGFYNTKDPRTTELGRFSQFKAIMAFNIVNPNTTQKDLFEMQLFFQDKEAKRNTSLVFGGLSKSEIPTLSIEDMNNGYKMPMGICNHSFYETYDYAVNHPINNNPYYGFILDHEGSWLDSHSIGIDGPLLHWDDQDPNTLHLWMLSFERHAFVGHYKIKFNNIRS